MKKASSPVTSRRNEAARRTSAQAKDEVSSGRRATSGKIDRPANEEPDAQHRALHIVSRALKAKHGRPMSAAEKTTFQNIWQWSDEKYAELIHQIAVAEGDRKPRISEELTDAIAAQYEKTVTTLNEILRHLDDKHGVTCCGPGKDRRLNTLVGRLRIDLVCFQLVGDLPGQAHAPRKMVIEVGSALAQRLMTAFDISKRSAWRAAALWAKCRDSKVTWEKVRDGWRYRHEKSTWIWNVGDA
jgi:hypothetical protein